LKCGVASQGAFVAGHRRRRRRSVMSLDRPGLVVSTAWRETETMRTGTFPEGKPKQCLCQRFGRRIAEPHPSMMALFGCLPARRAGEATPPDEASFSQHMHIFFAGSPGTRRLMSRWPHVSLT
jgi:hypothetical protein